MARWIPLMLLAALVGCDVDTPPVAPAPEREPTPAPLWSRPAPDSLSLRPLALPRYERFERDNWEIFAAFDLYTPRALSCDLELFDRASWLARHRLDLPADSSRLTLRFRPDPADRSLDTDERRALVIAYALEVDGQVQDSGRYAWYGPAPDSWRALLPAPASGDFLVWPRNERLRLCSFFWFPGPAEDVALLDGGRVLTGGRTQSLARYPHPVWVFRVRF